MLVGADTEFLCCFVHIADPVRANAQAVCDLWSLTDHQGKTVDKDTKSSKQKLILGTHTSEGEQNYLMIAEVALPTADSEAEAAQYDEERGEVGGFGAATGKVQVQHSSDHKTDL